MQPMKIILAVAIAMLAAACVHPISPNNSGTDRHNARGRDGRDHWSGVR
jgi:hypothetical protein